MRRLALALLIVASVAFVWPLAHRAASLPNAARTFRVATFNIHKGADRGGHYDLQRTIEAIARLDADVVGVQEAMQNHPDFNCDDQPSLTAEGLRKRTGRPWTHVFVKAWITDHRQCMERGRGKDIETEGLAIFARDRILASSSVRLSEGRVGLAVRVASMPDEPVIVTHLSANQENQPSREREIATLLPWAVRQGPGVLIGDLNARPDASELGPLMARYRDAWAEASARGRAGGVASGSTRPFGRVSRIDYVFYAPEGDLTLDSVEIVDTSTLGLGEVSDHHPVVATFRRNPPAHAAGPAHTR
ncbi:MAG TPA: endonuclease/exonuclease/phosphatase family protein [Vicinamibacterales bacterium]|jgi:endonuclease/exonuclease/phosphatase family metal-dependent hydrolase